MMNLKRNEFQKTFYMLLTMFIIFLFEFTIIYAMHMIGLLNVSMKIFYSINFILLIVSLGLINIFIKIHQEPESIKKNNFNNLFHPKTFIYIFLTYLLICLLLPMISLA
jgi:hypothetical protein